MIILGITGSVATGKTFVADFFKREGLDGFYADDVCHKLIQQNLRVIELISRFFPGVEAQGIIDKHKLAQIVFHDNQQLDRLEEILHPYIENEMLWFIEQSGRSEGGICFVEVPLLFESGWHKYCTYTLVTHCDATLQKQRALDRPGMDTQKFSAILARQMPDDQKKQRANFVVDTGKGDTHTLEQLEGVFSVLAEKYKELTLEAERLEAEKEKERRQKRRQAKQ